jgi:hypothetical protein
MTASEHIVRHCPKCGSIRVHGSRRRGPVDQILHAIGGIICRCHDCRARQAWFGISPISIGNTDPDSPPWAGIVAVGLGLTVCGVLMWWIVGRFTEISG